MRDFVSSGRVELGVCRTRRASLRAALTSVGPRRRFAAALLFLSLALVPLAVGCGDDDSGSDQEPGGNDKPKDAGGSSGGKKDAGSAMRDAATGGGKDAAISVPPDGKGVWAMMGYDVKNQYFNPQEKTLTVDNAAMLDKVWTATVAGFPPGTPTVAEGKVFVLATGGTYAFNLSDGSVAWMKTDIIGTSSIAYEDGFLYLHANPKGQLYKLKASNGDVVWGPVATYTDVGGTDGTSSAIVADGKVFAGHSTSNEIFPAVPTDQTEARGGVFAANAETGEEVWHYYTVELPENGAMVWSSVSVDLEAGVVYASTGDNYTVAGDNSDAIQAIDLKSGMRLWSTQVRVGDQWSVSKPTSQDTDFGANPILAELGGKKLVAAGDKGAAFWALDRESGEILWKREDLTPSHTPANGGVLMNGAFDGKRFYVVSNSPTDMTSTLFALNPEDGTDVWTHPFDKMTWGAPTVANGVLVVPVDAQLYVMNAATGDVITMFETGGSIAAGGAAIVDGKIIVQSGLQYPFGTPTNNNQVHCYALPQ